MKDHIYRMSQPGDGLGPARMWCALAECRGFGQVVADPGTDGGVFPHAWLIRKIAEHGVQFGNVELLDEPEPAQWCSGGHPVTAACSLPGAHPAGVARPPADVSWVASTDVSASWDVKLPEQRNSSGWFVLLGAALAVAGGILHRFLGWS